MPKKKRPEEPRETTDEAREAALLMVEHRDAKGGLGRRNAGASAAASALGRRRFGLMTPEERFAHQSKSSKAYWARMSPKERNIEARRRAEVARKNRLKKVRKTALLKDEK